MANFARWTKIRHSLFLTIVTRLRIIKESVTIVTSTSSVTVYYSL